MKTQKDILKTILAAATFIDLTSGEEVPIREVPLLKGGGLILKFTYSEALPEPTARSYASYLMSAFSYGSMKPHQTGDETSQSVTLDAADAPILQRIL